MQPRDYQRKAVDAVYDYFRDKAGNPLVVMPTGTGKSVVIALMLREALRTWPDTRVVVLTHVKELIAQNFSALIRAWPEAPAGIYSAGLNRRDISSQIIFAGIQSIAKKAYDLQTVDLVLIDEAHLLGLSDSGLYRKFLKALADINPYIKVIGFTATPYRLDQGMLTDGDEALFSDIAYDLPMLDMIEQGYLSPLIPKETTTQLDVSGVGSRGGEFIPGALEAAVDRDEITESAVDEIVRLGEQRGSWLVFASGVKHAEHVRDAIRRRGISCEMVSGDTPGPERDRVLREFKAGRIRCLTNANVLTTGFDAPGVDLVVLLRPTKSISLYVQMLGRGTRLANGKDDCLVLDFAGNTMRHGPVDTVGTRVAKKGKKDEPGEPLGKTCPECSTILGLAARECPCGYEFPPPKPTITHIADTAAVLSTQIKPEWVRVDAVSYGRHEKAGKASLVVTYSCGLAQHREWICLEHSGFPRQKAVVWWQQRAGMVQVPNMVDIALTQATTLRKPAAISVKPVGKYTEIVSARFE